MGASSFNEMELDAIGEIMNISLGASATAVSTMLGQKEGTFCHLASDSVFAESPPIALKATDASFE